MDYLNALSRVLLYLAIYYAPAMVANASPVFVGRGTPLDFWKAFWDGRRILGDGKTWEGVLVGLVFGSTIACVESALLESPTLFVYGLMGALGALTGDVVSSFFKRRMGLKRGAPLPLVDQLDFYVGATAFMVAVGWEPRWRYIVLGAIIIIILHKLTNLIAYYLRLKDVPW